MGGRSRRPRPPSGRRCRRQSSTAPVGASSLSSPPPAAAAEGTCSVAGLVGPRSLPVEHPGVLVAVLLAAEALLRDDYLSRVREPIPHNVGAPHSLPNQLGVEHQGFPF